MSEYPVPFASAAALADSSGQIVYAQGDLDQPFKLASVTKPLAAYAVLICVDRGLLSLDSTPTDLAEAGQFPAAALDPAPTLAHLLAHAGGLAYEGNGANRAAGAWPPGTKRVYSNQGIETAAAMAGIAAKTGVSELVRELVFAPLGMAATSIPGSPAHSGISTVSDLLRFGRELVEPTLLSADLHRRMTSVAFPGLRGILPGYGPQSPCDFGLGVEVRGHKSPHWTTGQLPPETVGHFGVSGSLLWAVPIGLSRGGLVAAFLGEELFGDWHKANWPALQDHMLAAAGL